ncbi:MAG: TonB-dependent receptor, partial [Gemmatimonadales bacterium]
MPPDPVDQTKRYLEAQAQVGVHLNALPPIRDQGPRPAMSRVVVDRDSLDWATAETVAELLQRVPGVYLWRGGWIGRPEYPNFQGRGTASVEYVLDGLPYVPIGPDSLAVDPSLLALTFLDRIEIERWPGLLRVHLFTRRHDSRAPGSRIGIASGDQRFARYSGALQRRFNSGLGFAVAGEYLNSPTITGVSGDDTNTDYWLQASYVPSPRFGAQYQLVLMEPDRRPYGANGTPLRGTRTDAQARVFFGGRADGTGPRVDLLYGRIGWSGSGIDNQVNQGGVVASYRAPTFSLGASGFNRSRWTPLDFHLQAGWAPTGAIAASAEAGYQTHDFKRTSQWVGLRGGLRLPLSIEASAAVRTGSIVAAPSLRTDPAQRVTDLQAAIGWQRPRLGLELTYGRTDGFRPQTYQPFLTVDSLGPSGRTQWVTVAWRVAPRSWLTLDGWYSDPSGAAPEGLPPTHSLSSATIRSKFWRTFPSGTFDFKAQGSMEAWSDGVLGRDATGAPIELRGATFFRSYLSLRLQGFT